MKKRRGHSSVGRATASQAVGRGFEPLCPLFFLIAPLCLILAAGCLTPKGREDNAGVSETTGHPGIKPITSDTVSPQPKPEEKKVYHVVREGDTLWRVAKAYGIEQEEIMKANGMSGTTVEVGQKLLIPGAKEPVAVEKYRPPKAGRKFVRGESFGYPCVGRIATGFGQWRNEQKTEGIDFAAVRGTRVVASRTGEVVLVARAFPGYGVVVILRHGPSYKTFYGYLSETSLQAGDAVAKGESLGVTGIEPRSGEPRLHFRVYEGTAAVNPVKHLK